MRDCYDDGVFDADAAWALPFMLIAVCFARGHWFIGLLLSATLVRAFVWFARPRPERPRKRPATSNAPKNSRESV